MSARHHMTSPTNAFLCMLMRLMHKKTHYQFFSISSKFCTSPSQPKSIKHNHLWSFSWFLSSLPSLLQVFSLPSPSLTAAPPPSFSFFSSIFLSPLLPSLSLPSLLHLSDSLSPLGSFLSTSGLLCSISFFSLLLLSPRFLP